MQSLTQLLTTIFADAFAACGYDRELIQVFVSQRPDLGQFQCNSALRIAQRAKKEPREVAATIVAALPHCNIFHDVKIAGPGFINISLDPAFLADYLQQMREDDKLGCPLVSTPENVVIDFGGPNVAKPMHVGHLRSTIIGDCLQRLFRYLGHHVTSDVHLGDWGTQMGMLICELKQRQPELQYFDEDFSGLYPSRLNLSLDELEKMYRVANARCEEYPIAMLAAQEATVQLQRGRRGYRALWEHFKKLSEEKLKEDFAQLGVAFDLWNGESSYNDRIPVLIKELEAQKQITPSEGAWVIPLEQENSNKPLPPLMMIKSDGGYLYASTDLAALEERVTDLKANRILYVVDKRQSLHFEQLFQAARRTGIARDASLEHIAFGTVNGPDGKPFKTREGGAMRLSDLLEIVVSKATLCMRSSGVGQNLGDEEAQQRTAKTVGIAALKFADLINNRTSDYIFDPDKFTSFEGKTGPYLLYATVRIRSILNKAKERGLAPNVVIRPKTPAEQQLMLQLSLFADAMYTAYECRAPHYLCEYAYALSQAFSSFYHDSHILSEPNVAQQGSWLALSELCLAVLERVLNLLGCEVPDRM